MTGRGDDRPVSLARRVGAEAVGSAFLSATVIGSGIMGERLAAGNGALALLANTLATAAMLLALIVAIGGISGAHFNPLVTLVGLARRRTSSRDALAYVGAQFTGMVAGTLTAHAMFGLPLLTASTRVRAGFPQLLSEGVAALGLIVVVGLAAARAARLLPLAIAGYVAAGYWFTASTCFANPAVTVARSLSDTFAGIRPVDVPGFLIAQLVGAAFGGVLVEWWSPARRTPVAPPPAVASRPASVA